MTTLEVFLKKNRLLIPSEVFVVFEEFVMDEGIGKEDGDPGASHQISFLEKLETE